MKIEEFIEEIELIINSELYEVNLITYTQYITALKEIGKKKVC